MRTTPALSLLILLGTLTLLPPGQTPASGQQRRAASAEVAGYDPTLEPEIRATPAVGEIEIDGVPEEEAWDRAQPFVRFIQRNPEEGEPVSEVTEVRILLDDDALLIGAWLRDSRPDSIRTRMARRDSETDSDLLFVQIDSRHDHLTAYAFGITPSGAYQDAARGSDGGLDFSWDPVWESAARLGREGWTAEMRIPLSQLRFESGAGRVWGLQITRTISRKQEEAVLAFVPLSEEGGVHRFGHLTIPGDLREPGRMELLPYAVARADHLNIAPDDPFRSDREYTGSVGLDLKYGITGDLTLDATINPDFGQVELDPAVVNLTAYETFYPEQRPFFVEGAEIFRFGYPGFGLLQPDLGQLFYSRRVGRAPQRSLRGPGYAYTDSPETTTIAGAMKVSGRLGSNWSFGLMEAVTLRESGRFLDGGGAEQSVPVEPLTNYLVGRARRDLRGGNTTIGALFTGVQRRLGDPDLESLLHGGAFVTGLDFNHTWGNREWFVNGSLAASRVEGSAEAIARTQRSSARYFQRPDAAHVDFDPTRTSLSGYRASLGAGRQAGRHWLGSVLISETSPGWEINDAGFETRVDRRTAGALLQYRETAPNRWTRYYQVDLLSRHVWNTDGDYLDSGLDLGHVVQWSNYWTHTFMIGWRPGTMSDDLTRGGPLARRPGGWRASFYLSTDARKPHNLSTNFSWANNEFGGWGIFPNVTVLLRPSPALEVSVGSSFRRSHAIAMYVTAIPDPLASHTLGGRYVFSSLDETMLSLDTRISWTFTPGLSLQLYAQPFLATGDYRGFQELQEPRTLGFHLYGEDRGTIERSQGGIYTVDPDGDGPAQAFSFPDPDFNIRSLRGNAVLRWEYRPGSTIYFVWQQGRFSYSPVAEFDFFEDQKALFRTPPENVFVVKASWWLGR